MDLSVNAGTLVVGGGLGDSLRAAVVLKRTPRGMSAIEAEFLYVAQRFGAQRTGWRIEGRHLHRLEGRSFDELRIVLPDGSRRVLFFEVTALLTQAHGPRP